MHTSHHFLVFMMGEACHGMGGGGTTEPDLFHTGSLSSDKTVEHLPLPVKYMENRKLRENFPLVLFSTATCMTFSNISPPTGLHYDVIKTLRQALSILCFYPT